MPPTARPLLHRLLITAGLSAITLLALLAGAYWVVFHRPSWVFFLAGNAGEWIERNSHRIYAARLRSWPSPDTNDNGVPDWYEELYGKDLRKDALRAECIVNERPGYVFLGERTRIRLELEVSPDDNVTVPWPAETELLLTAPSPVLLSAESAEGTPPTAGPLRIHATPDGRLEFDVLYLRAPSDDDIAPDPVTGGYVTLVHARSGFRYTVRTFHVAHWRLPTVPSRIEQRPVDLKRYPLYKLVSAPGPVVRPHLVWEPLPDPDLTYILQAARADAPDDWHGFQESYPPPFLELIDDYDRTYFRGYTGPLLYRVVPVRWEKPAER